MSIFRVFLGAMILLLLFAADRKNLERYPVETIHAEEESVPLEGRDFVYYTVQPGDSFSVIERKFRVASVDAILELNPELDPDRLRAHEKIKIPL